LGLAFYWTTLYTNYCYPTVTTTITTTTTTTNTTMITTRLCLTALFSVIMGHIFEKSYDILRRNLRNIPTGWHLPTPCNKSVPVPLLSRHTV